MKTFAKIFAALMLTAAIAPMAMAAPKMTMAPKTAKPAMKSVGRKGGYVKATTYVTKKGTVVHRKGTYRHSTKKMVPMSPNGK